MLELGAKVRVTDPADFYNGRIGTVTALTAFFDGAVVVATVSIPTGTGTGFVTGAHRDTNLEVLK